MIITGLVVLSCLYTNGMSQETGKYIRQTRTLGALTLPEGLPIVKEIKWWNDPALSTSHTLIISSGGAEYTTYLAKNRLTQKIEFKKDWLKFTYYKLTNLRYLYTDFYDDVRYFAKRVREENIQKSVFAVSTDPTFDLTSGLADSDIFPLNEDFFHPSAYTLASRINFAAGKMPADRKIILVGKGMGGCQMMKAANKLQGTLDIDQLILVDASCTLDKHVSEYKNINSNVKEAFSFYQRSRFQLQSGYPILQNGHQLRENTDVSNGFCPKVSHAEIDTCEPLLHIMSYLSMRIIHDAP
ncbi:MAG: hypothetical protein OCD01_04450 [Fibrobacterales bacterium]